MVDERIDLDAADMLLPLVDEVACHSGDVALIVERLDLVDRALYVDRVAHASCARKGRLPAGAHGNYALIDKWHEPKRVTEDEAVRGRSAVSAVRLFDEGDRCGRDGPAGGREPVALGEGPGLQLGSRP